MFQQLVLCVLSLLTLSSSSPSPQKARVFQATEQGSYLVQRLRNVQKPGIQMFLADVSAGTPPQQMTVTFETISNESYVPSIACEDPNCMTRSRYDSSNSSTYEPDGRPFNSLNISGILSRDVLGFAGVSLANQTFGEADHMFSAWQQYLPNDGSFGLGYSSRILDHLNEQGLISQRIFGMYFGSGDDDGELTLGGINEHLYTGEIQYADIVPDENEWVVHMDGLTVENQPGLKLGGARDSRSTFLTSAPYFSVSMDTAQRLNEALGGTPLPTPGAYSFDCTRLYHMPAVSLGIGGMVVSFQASEYTVISSSEAAQLCISGFLGNPDLSEDNWAMGTLFMQKVFTVFDKESSRVGFAHSK